MESRGCMARPGCAPHAVLGLALVVLSLATTAGAAKYGDTCSKATDCEERSAPYCYTFFTDKSYHFNKIDTNTLTGAEFTSALIAVNMVPRRQGMCVECVTDCDCSVNEFCGYDFDDSYDKDTKEWTYTYKVTIPAGITSANTGGGMPANIKKEVELYAKQVEGLPIKSKCKKYSTSHIKGSPKVCDANMDVSAFGKMVEESMLSQAGPVDMLSTCDFKDKDRRTAVERTPKIWPKDAQDRVCGRLVSFGPKFFETKYIGEVADTSLIKNAEFQMSADMSTGNSYDDVARCVPTVVAADTITCPSCLHSADVGALTANDCFTPRQDKLVCCSSLLDWNDDSRTCHHPAATADMAYPAYTTCESACRRAGTPEVDYYDECKDPATGEQKAAMKDVAPDTDAAANKKTWCTCVDACLMCTSGAGGIGERPTGLTNMDSDFTAIHGTCVPPPASWETLTNGDTAQKPPTATNFICAAADPAESCSSARPTNLVCKPACVDCLVKAMQHGCAGETDRVAKCPTTTFTLHAMGECKVTDFTPSRDEYYEFKVDSSPVEWLGYCQSGNCKACAEGEKRCHAGNRDSINVLPVANPQICSGGEWVSTAAFNRQEPVLNVQSRALIAIAVMVGVCFLALLGVIVAVIMLRKRSAAKASEPIAAATKNENTSQPPVRPMQNNPSAEPGSNWMPAAPLPGAAAHVEDGFGTV